MSLRNLVLPGILTHADKVMMMIMADLVIVNKNNKSCLIKDVFLPPE